LETDKKTIGDQYSLEINIIYVVVTPDLTNSINISSGQ